MIRTIVFDMDGVLINSEQRILAAWEEVARQKNIPDIAATLMKCIGITAPETEATFKRAYGENFPYAEYTSLASAIFHKEIEEHGMPMKPGVYELFDHLKENNYKIGLASSTKESTVRRQMEMAGLLPYFDVIVCGDMVSHSKPHPEIYGTAAKLLHTEPSLCYAIEDSPNGIRSAYAAGMKPLMVPDLIAPDEEIQRLYYKCFASLYDVQKFLSNNP